ncbi:nucleotide sugar dehydrogenase [Bacillus sp. H8-1]|nr:nucleotide sugar dehydrogenase [Bacillus sp. H8-1]
MSIYNKVLSKEESIAVIGLGYVGMPLAIEFAKYINVIGFDINKEKVEKYKNGIDVTNEVGNEIIKNTSMHFTNDENKLKEAKVFIVAVPTPISSDKMPDLSPVIGASKLVGRNLTKGSYIVYESTVYPGVTEDVCIPILEEESGLKCGIDFKVGYSPERINPGDKVHRLDSIVKVVSAIDQEALDEISSIYEIVVKAGVHKASSIKVAEAAKVVENSQRDINIAFMNELAMVFDKMGIETSEVIKAMDTKWNSLGFYPGLVGGHCIGVDPYYFIYKAEQLGYRSQIIASGRKINDDMGKFVGQSVVKKLINADKKVKGANIAVLGLAFKEDCPDVRNSKVIDIVNYLNEFDVNIQVVDPVVDSEEAYREYGIELYSLKSIRDLDAIVLAVGHKEFKQLNLDELSQYYVDDNKIFIDVKSIRSKQEATEKGFSYWSL